MFIYPFSFCLFSHIFADILIVFLFCTLLDSYKTFSNHTCGLHIPFYFLSFCLKSDLKALSAIGTWIITQRGFLYNYYQNIFLFLTSLVLTAIVILVIIIWRKDVMVLIIHNLITLSDLLFYFNNLIPISTTNLLIWNLTFPSLTTLSFTYPNLNYSHFINHLAFQFPISGRVKYLSFLEIVSAYLVSPFSYIPLSS